MVNIILGFVLCLLIVLILLIFVLINAVAEREAQITDEKEVAATLLNEWLELQFEDETKEESEERKFYTLIDEAAKLKLRVDKEYNPGESL
uniref:Uncharacterized protein n=1 Tax=Siphoviridae sp. ctfWC31 TaxID=2826414 RepID=A0A8S5N7W7_9CAUD|nr:MAG TPA: hypothetical protein [Siphoviridae sp. ctfWC31]